MLIPKEIMRPGVYWYTDPDTGEPRQLVVTPEYIRYLMENGNAMRAAGLSIPLPFEHQMEARPLTAAERAAQNLMNNAGWVDSFLIEKGDRLFGMCEVDDKTYPDLAARLPKTIRYTSPWLTTFTDGSGKKWEGVIGHLALTSRPRIVRQEPFKDVAAALSIQKPPLPLTKEVIKDKGVDLSRAGYLTPNKDGLYAPHLSAAFSVWSGVTLAQERSPGNPKVEPKKPPEGKEEKERVEKKPEGEHTDGEEEQEGKSLKDMGQIDTMVDLLDAIFDLHIEVPEGGNEEHLANAIIKALCAHLKGEGVEPELGDEKVPDTKTNPAEASSKTQVVQESPPLYMSLTSEAVAKITDPEKKAYAEALLSMQTQAASDKKRTDSIVASLIAAATARRNARLEALGKRMPVAQRDQLMQMAAGVSLSLADDGKVVDPLEQTMQLLEATTRNLPALLTAQSAELFKEESHPQDYTGTVTEERRQQIVQEQMRNGGMVRPKAG